MIALHINPPRLPTHYVPAPGKSASSAHIHKGSLMASRGTRGPSPQTETFHRPTGRAEKSQEKNIKSEGEREGSEKEREGEGKQCRVRECLHHEWNRNDAPLGSIRESLHTMAASPTSKAWQQCKVSSSQRPADKGLSRKTHLL